MPPPPRAHAALSRPAVRWIEDAPPCHHLHERTPPSRAPPSAGLLGGRATTCHRLYRRAPPSRILARDRPFCSDPRPSPDPGGRRWRRRALLQIRVRRRILVMAGEAQAWIEGRRRYGTLRARAGTEQKRLGRCGVTGTVRRLPRPSFDWSRGRRLVRASPGSRGAVQSVSKAEVGDWCKTEGTSVTSFHVVRGILKLDGRGM